LFEEVYYEADNPEQKALALLKKAACLKQRREFDLAARRLAETAVFGLSDSLTFQVQYQSALCYYLAADFLTASARLKNLAFRFTEPACRSDVAFLHTLVWNELREYDSAYLSARAFIDLRFGNKPLQDSLIRMIELHYSAENRPHLKNPEKAEWFSRIIPGSGQAYLGFPGEGSMSFLLNALSLGTGILGVLSGYPVSGYIIGAGMLQKFYYGGLRRTAFLTEKANFERSHTFNEQSRDLILRIHD